MLKIRLKRIGRKHDPSYRLVVVDSKTGPKSANYVENLGNYNPKFPVEKAEVNGERVKHWLAIGAHLSDTAHNLLVNKNIIKAKKRNALPKKTAQVKEGAEAEVAPETASEAPSSDTPAGESETDTTPAETETATETPESEAAEEKAAE